jgi:hypothetical protein
MRSQHKGHKAVMYLMTADGQKIEIGETEGLMIAEEMGRPMSFSTERRVKSLSAGYSATMTLKESKFAHDHTSPYLSQWFERVTVWY